MYTRVYTYKRARVNLRKIRENCMVYVIALKIGLYLFKFPSAYVHLNSLKATTSLFSLCANLKVISKTNTRNGNDCREFSIVDVFCAGFHSSAAERSFASIFEVWFRKSRSTDSRRLQERRLLANLLSRRISLQNKTHPPPLKRCQRHHPLHPGCVGR